MKIHSFSGNNNEVNPRSWVIYQANEMVGDKQ